MATSIKLIPSIRPNIDDLPEAPPRKKMKTLESGPLSDFFVSEGKWQGPTVERAVKLLATDEYSKQLGSGGHGSVLLIESPLFPERATGLKVIKKEMAERDPKLHSISEERTDGEALGLLLKDCEHVVHTHGVLVESPDGESVQLLTDLSHKTDGVIFAVLTEYEPESITLADYFKRRRENLSPEDRLVEVKEIGSQVVDAVKEIHAKQISHRDLKPENILINPLTKEVKVLDFGLCREGGRMALAQSICGSYGYMAPELFTGKGYDSLKADLFIVGALLHFMVYDDILEIDLDEFDPGVEKLAVDYVNKDTKISFQSKTATEPLYQKVNSLILALTRGDPEKRPTLEEVSERLKLI